MQQKLFVLQNSLTGRNLIDIPEIHGCDKLEGNILS